MKEKKRKKEEENRRLLSNSVYWLCAYMEWEGSATDWNTINRRLIKNKNFFFQPLRCWFPYEFVNANDEKTCACHVHILKRTISSECRDTCLFIATT